MMSFFDQAVLVGYALPRVANAGVEPVLALLSAGVFAMGLSDIASGLAERLAEEDDDGPPDPAGEQDPFGGDESADEFGGGQFGEEGFGDDDFDDDFGGLDDWDDDGGEGLDGSGGGSAGQDPRIEELEDEVANISSTVSTVRSENQAINESVEEIEDNMRQLLDIYEMVTRGVNPFVDDVGGGGMEGSFGLFEGDGDEGFDEIDPDVADADADSFFDDDFDDTDLDDDGGDPFGDDEAPLDDEPAQGAEELFEDAEGSTEPPTETGDTGPDGDEGDGKTFEELKSEYDSGEVDWQSDESSPEEVEGAGSSEESVEAEPRTAESNEPVVDAADDEPPEAGSADAESESVASTDGGSEQDDDVESTDSGGKPYLQDLPDGYATELLVIEWLTYLRSRSSTSEALRAIRYYETIDWIGSPAAGALQEYLTGLADGTPEAGSHGGTQLTIDHHTHSLRYISRLGGADVEVERLDWPSPPRGDTRLERGEQRGIQR